MADLILEIFGEVMTKKNLSFSITNAQKLVGITQ